MKIALNCLPNRILVLDIPVHHLFSLECCGISWLSVMQMKTHVLVEFFFFFYNLDAFIRILYPRCSICHLKWNLYGCEDVGSLTWPCKVLKTCWDLDPDPGAESNWLETPLTRLSLTSWATSGKSPSPGPGSVKLKFLCFFYKVRLKTSTRALLFHWFSTFGD